MHSTTVLDQVAAELGLTLVTRSSIDGSFSGSRVLPVITADGTEAILKITIGPDNRARAISERELRFYLELADRVGVKTPKVLDHRAEDDSIAILMTRHPPAEPATRWSRGRWLALADDLAQIHSSDVPPDFGSPQPRVVTADPTVRSFWADGDHRLSRLLESPDQLRRRAELLGSCFVHGDCHTDNISPSADGRLVWLDWQNAGLGNPAGDLAFASARATPAGADVPIGDMTARYADHLGLPRDLVQAAVSAAELLTMLFDWPEYAEYQTETGLRRLRDRAGMLAREQLED